MRHKHEKTKRHIKHNHKYLLFIFLFILLVTSGLIIKGVFFPPVFSLLHGPHLSKALYESELNQGETLGAKIRRKIFQPTPTPTIINLPVPTPTIIAIKRQYGIAAGGILPYLSQADLDLYFSQLKELGVTWIRYDFDWGLIQKKRNRQF